VVKVTTIKIVLSIVAVEDLYPKQFALKDLGVAKQILGMRIIRDNANSTLKTSQTKYVKKIFSKFSMIRAKSGSTLLEIHFRLTKDQSPKMDQEKAYTSNPGKQY
jgi:hypothetical protein